jgi:Protein of unknown function (DUF1176)
MMHTYFIRLFFVIFIALLCAFGHQATAAGTSSSSRYAEFWQWLVACDNVGDCEAIGFDETEASLVIHIYRDAGPNSEISITIEGAGSQPFDQFMIDGKKVALSSQAWLSSKDDGYKITSKNNDTALKFIASIRNAERIGFFNSNTPENSMSLKGLSAALLLTDEVQGRLGSQNAFIRKGNTPESAITAARPLPQLKARTYRGKPIDELLAKKVLTSIRKQFSILLKKEDCDTFSENTFDEASLLSASEAIAFIECTRGAYQNYFLVFRTPVNDLKKATQLRLPMEPGKPIETAIGNASYDANTGILSAYGKGRGLFDCGDTTDWVFDGRNFLLANHTFLGRCGGTTPGEFPSLWRSEIK